MTSTLCGRGLIAGRLAARLRSLKPSSVHVVLDGRAAAAVESALIRALKSQPVEWTIYRVPGGERVKTMATVERLARKMVRAGVDRRSVLLAVGGGATSDLTGTLAALLLRGLRWGVVGTTLLSAVDAGSGGKAAVNLPEGKNLLGRFHPPEFVLAELGALRTLPAREIQSGLGEVVKTAMLAGPALLRRLEKARPAELRRAGTVLEAVVRACMRHKAAVVATDPEDHGERKLLNLGHSFGHALETAASGRLAHGEAVALGLRCSLGLSVEQELCSPAYAARIEAQLDRLGLPDSYPGKLPTAARLRTLLIRDKKADDGRLELVLPLGPGRNILVAGVTPAEAAAAIRRRLG